MDAIEQLKQDEKECWDWWEGLELKQQNGLMDKLIFEYWEHNIKET